MPLSDVDVIEDPTPPPGDVRIFLCEARRRIERFQEEGRVPGFVASDFAVVYAALRAVAAAPLAPGNLFCEWGSGFGVVACLAAMLGFDACGIEIEAELVDHARRLAGDFGLSVHFFYGNFLTSEPADFDVVFAYPWPDEEQLIERLFEHQARTGAVLVSHHGEASMRVRRKIARRPGPGTALNLRKRTPGRTRG